METRNRVIHLRDVQFPFLPLESIQSHSPGKKPPFPQIFCDVERGLTSLQVTLATSVASSQWRSTTESRDTRPRRMQEVNS